MKSSWHSTWSVMVAIIFNYSAFFKKSEKFKGQKILVKVCIFT